MKFLTEVLVFGSRKGRLHNERALHRAQSATHPLCGGSAIAIVQDTVIDLGEGPDRGIWSGSSGNGTKLVAWVENLSHAILEKKKVAYG